MVIVIGSSGPPIEDICLLVLAAIVRKGGATAIASRLPWCSPRALLLPSTEVRYSIVYIDVDVATCKGSVRIAPSSISHPHPHSHHMCIVQCNCNSIQFTRSFALRGTPLHTLLTFPPPRPRSPQGISPTPEVERLPGRLQGSPILSQSLLAVPIRKRD